MSLLLTLNIFYTTPWSSVAFVNFEHVIAGRVDYRSTVKFRDFGAWCFSFGD